MRTNVEGKTPWMAVHKLLCFISCFAFNQDKDLATSHWSNFIDTNRWEMCDCVFYCSGTRKLIWHTYESVFGLNILTFETQIWKLKLEWPMEKDNLKRPPTFDWKTTEGTRGRQRKSIVALLEKACLAHEKCNIWSCGDPSIWESCSACLITLCLRATMRFATAPPPSSCRTRKSGRFPTE